MSEEPTPDAMTLDELRVALAPRIPAHAAFDGWTEAAIARAAAELGVPADRARLAFPGGAPQMIEAWFGWVDTMMAAALPPERIGAMKIRERIRSLITTRLEILTPYREALRRALAILAFPANAALAARLAWRGADAMWRLAGDSATDFSHYTKRMTLAAVYSSTLLVWMDDESDGFAATYGFLDRRIEDVMRFERMKAKLKPRGGQHFSLARFLGRLRYPVS